MAIDLRTLMRGALACVCCIKADTSLASDAPARGGASAHWSYEGDGNPEKWGELQSDFRMCQLGLEQTPIDLGNSIKGDVGSVDYDYKPLPLRILNNGHTIQVNADPGSACVIGGTRYGLLQFHLHHPSEHLLAGKGLDLECHLVHRSGAGALAVTGVFHPARGGERGPEDILRADARQARHRSASRRHYRCCDDPPEDRWLIPLHGIVDDASLFGRPDLDGPQGAN